MADYPKPPDYSRLDKMDGLTTTIRPQKRQPADPVNHPTHYTRGGIEVIDFIEDQALSYRLGNVVKYVTRAGHKNNALEDLKKARWYLDREIKNLETPTRIINVVRTAIE